LSPRIVVGDRNNETKAPTERGTLVLVRRRLASGANVPEAAVDDGVVGSFELTRRLYVSSSVDSFCRTSSLMFVDAGFDPVLDVFRIVGEQSALIISTGTTPAASRWSCQPIDVGDVSKWFQILSRRRSIFTLSLTRIAVSSPNPAARWSVHLPLLLALGELRGNTGSFARSRRAYLFRNAVVVLFGDLWINLWTRIWSAGIF